MTTDYLNPELLAAVMSERGTRVALARQSHYYFFNIYLGHYVQYPTADFQRELFALTEDESTKLAVIVAFRNSGKSTIMDLSYPIWAIVGRPQKKFVLILSRTQGQAQLLLVNLKRELESNDLLRGDLGALDYQTDEWGRDSLVIPKYKARIMAASMEQSIRGARHWQHRPDLIIVDDCEDQNSVKTREGRDKTFNYLTGEVMPAGDANTKLIIVGNFLHEDSVMMRLRHSLEHRRLAGVFRWYPLLNSKGVCLWPGKFPDKTSIIRLRQTIASESAWQREFLLRIISDQEQVVHKKWLHFYDTLPSEDDHSCEYRFTGVGIDLAISQNETADFTAMVTAKVFGYNEKARIYILPHPVNERLTFPRQVDKIKTISKLLDKPDLYIEDVGYQSALIQHLQDQGFEAEGVKVHGADKRARLATITHFIQNGQILFPRRGASKLIEQLTGFGVETHDDLADAFAILIHMLMGEKKDYGRSRGPAVYAPKLADIETCSRSCTNPRHLHSWDRITRNMQW